MSLDDDHAPWVAEALAKGEDPSKVRPIPEVEAAEAIGRILSRYADPRWHTDAFWTYVGSKCIANRNAIAAEFAKVDADPRRLRDRGTVLRQQVSSQLDSVTWWEEHAGHLKRELDDALDVLERVRRGTIAEYDPDARGADEDDRRLSQEARDDAAREQAPRVAS